ncbi:hypothetical protein R1flu_004384 [Riccia fluitans]|uniref:Uncharacterized protein n=1 Tax=Riccia fluitans TaxID=41844 RepID=A0ABD1YQX7_9MARC
MQWGITHSFPFTEKTNPCPSKGSEGQTGKKQGSDQEKGREEDREVGNGGKNRRRGVNGDLVKGLARLLREDDAAVVGLQ